MNRLFSVLALGIALTLRLTASPIVPVSYSYNQGPWQYWDDTGKQLTDGLYNGLIPGINLATPDAYNWVGFAGGMPSFTFDFGAVVTIDNVSLSMAKWNPAGVYLPGLVDINSTIFTVVDGYTDMDHVLLNFNSSWTGSLLTVTITPQYPGVWTFIDEVTFNEATGGGGSSVPDSGSTLPLAVTALLSLLAIRARSRTV